jgi:hypothetical protein
MPMNRGVKGRQISASLMRCNQYLFWGVARQFWRFVNADPDFRMSDRGQ